MKLPQVGDDVEYVGESGRFGERQTGRSHGQLARNGGIERVAEQNGLKPRTLEQTVRLRRRASARHNSMIIISHQRVSLF